MIEIDRIRAAAALNVISYRSMRDERLTLECGFICLAGGCSMFERIGDILLRLCSDGDIKAFAMLVALRFPEEVLHTIIGDGEQFADIVTDFVREHA